MTLVIPLSCAVQKYAWGHIGSESEVAKLAFSSQVQHSEVTLDSNANYAEVLFV